MKGCWLLLVALLCASTAAESHFRRHAALEPEVYQGEEVEQLQDSDTEAEAEEIEDEDAMEEEHDMPYDHTDVGSALLETGRGIFSSAPSDDDEQAHDVFSVLDLASESIPDPGPAESPTKGGAAPAGNNVECSPTACKKGMKCMKRPVICADKTKPCKQFRCVVDDAPPKFEENVCDPNPCPEETPSCVPNGGVAECVKGKLTPKQKKAQKCYKLAQGLKDKLNDESCMIGRVLMESLGTKGMERDELVPAVKSFCAGQCKKDIRGLLKQLQGCKGLGKKEGAEKYFKRAETYLNLLCTRHADEGFCYPKLLAFGQMFNLAKGSGPISGRAPPTQATMGAMCNSPCASIMFRKMKHATGDLRYAGHYFELMCTKHYGQFCAIELNKMEKVVFGSSADEFEDPSGLSRLNTICTPCAQIIIPTLYDLNVNRRSEGQVTPDMTALLRLLCRPDGDGGFCVSRAQNRYLKASLEKMDICMPKQIPGQMETCSVNCRQNFRKFIDKYGCCSITIFEYQTIIRGILRETKARQTRLTNAAFVEVDMRLRLTEPEAKGTASEAETAPAAGAPAATNATTANQTNATTIDPAVAEANRKLEVKEAEAAAEKASDAADKESATDKPEDAKPTSGKPGLGKVADVVSATGGPPAPEKPPLVPGMPVPGFPYNENPGYYQNKDETNERNKPVDLEAVEKQLAPKRPGPPTPTDALKMIQAMDASITSTGEKVELKELSAGEYFNGLCKVSMSFACTKLRISGEFIYHNFAYKYFKMRKVETKIAVAKDIAFSVKVPVGYIKVLKIEEFGAPGVFLELEEQVQLGAEKDKKQVDVNAGIKITFLILVDDPTLSEVIFEQGKASEADPNVANLNAFEPMDSQNDPSIGLTGELRLVPSCYDGIKNQDEEAKDCGGDACSRCPKKKAVSAPAATTATTKVSIPTPASVKMSSLSSAIAGGPRGANDPIVTNHHKGAHVMAWVDGLWNRLTGWASGI